MLRVRVKSIPVPSWCNSEGEKIIKAFNSQPEPLYLVMHDDNIVSREQLADGLEQGMYDLDYPDSCAESAHLEHLMLLVDDSEKVARFLEFGIDDVVSNNILWAPLFYDNYGVARPLVNVDKKLTMLSDDVHGKYCVAYGYDPTDNTWSQGHYFNDFYKALEYMYAPVSDPEYDQMKSRKIFIANIIPSNWFDAAELENVVDTVYSILEHVIEIDERDVILTLKKLGYDT